MGTNEVARHFPRLKYTCTLKADGEAEVIAGYTRGGKPRVKVERGLSWCVFDKSKDERSALGPSKASIIAYFRTADECCKFIREQRANA